MNHLEMTRRPLAETVGQFDRMLEQLENASSFAKANYQGRLLDVARRIMVNDGGLAVLRDRVARADAAGLFAGSDWDRPEALLPGLVGGTLRDGPLQTKMLECMSLLRFGVVASGSYQKTGLTAEAASEFLAKVLALNLARIFGTSDEASRASAGSLDPAINRLFSTLLEIVGPMTIQEKLVDEVHRVLAQRPIQIDHIKGMIAQIAVTGSNANFPRSHLSDRARRLVEAAFSPTSLCADDPGLCRYGDRLSSADDETLKLEAETLAKRMHETGIVSDYHPAFVRWAVDHRSDALLGRALGLSSTGLDAMRCYSALTHDLIRTAVFPETAQAVLGLALMLERGILYSPPVAPSFWRMLDLTICNAVQTVLSQRFGTRVEPRAYLVAGLLQMLGLPLGVGQGNNPTCQSARALSLWALNDPDYLLHIVAQTALHDNLIMHFEGQRIESKDLGHGLVTTPVLDTDPISAILVPHLDKLYAEMGRRCGNRGEDPHRWINPELHGWWVGRDFHIAVDVNSGLLAEHRNFVSRFCAAYHPTWNGHQQIVHPQPVGIAATTNTGTFIGWHAISLIRVSLDQDGVMRVYFYNPNNDSGQDWGNGTVVSTEGHGERFGEASLPFEQFAAYVYIFHDDPISAGDCSIVPASLVDKVVALTAAGWGMSRQPE
ncbi:hypothetical protein GCM10007908_20160 [Rhizobium albus]|nr:hypothetical protein GCM10007908_20160 [Rhizobium albus]